MQITEAAAGGSQIEGAQIITKRGIADEQELSIPPAIRALDVCAEYHWPVLLRKSGVTIGAQRMNERRLYMLKNFGIPDLEFRLQCQSGRKSVTSFKSRQPNLGPSDVVIVTTQLGFWQP